MGQNLTYFDTRAPAESATAHAQGSATIQRMHTGSCHCGQIKLTLPATPAIATACNCSLCRRIGGPWVYFGWGTVHIEAEPDALVPYIQGDKTLRTMRCRNCGVVTHWEPLPAESGARHGVNLANFEPALIAAVPTRKFDGAVSWRFADDLQRDTDMLQALYAAINANNIEATAAQFAPEITRTEPDGFSGAGTYDGATAVQACLAQGRNTWAEGTCEPEQFFAYGPKMVVYLHVRVRLNGSTDWVDARFADGLALQNGKITEWRSFNDRSAAMAWAGIAG